jgi:hypothetical protein
MQRLRGSAFGENGRQIMSVFTKSQREVIQCKQFRATFSGNDQVFYGPQSSHFRQTRVTKLIVVQNETQGIETVTWLDPPYLKIQPPDYMPVVADRSRICCVVRSLDLPLSRDLRRGL